MCLPLENEILFITKDTLFVCEKCGVTLPGCKCKQEWQEDYVLTVGE